MIKNRKKHLPIFRYSMVLFLTTLFVANNSFAISYSAFIKPAAKQMEITAKNKSRFKSLKELKAFKLQVSCYRRKGATPRLGIVNDHYFLFPIKLKSQKLTRRVQSQQRKRLSVAVHKASRHCKRLGSQSNTTGTNPPPASTQIETPSFIPQPRGPRVEIPAIPMRAEWESQMSSYGRTHCQNLSNSNISLDGRLAATYYDSEWVYYQIGDYTNDNFWYSCAQAAETVYRDSYVFPNGGKVPGYWNFSHGLTRDYLSSGDSTSLSAAVLLAQNASYAPDWTPLGWTADSTMSREVAYAIMSYLNAEQIGQPHRNRTEDLVNQALSHIDQWFISRNAQYVRPFMFALTAQALISYDSQKGGNGQILQSIRTGANWIWDNCWLEGAQTFRYTDRVVDSGGTEPAPDLNLLIAPVFAWLWHQTGDPIYRERADKIFVGGVNGAYLVNAKQFNQSYRWSFDYIKWRSMAPRS